MGEDMKEKTLFLIFYISLFLISNITSFLVGMSIGYYEYYNIPVGFHETSPITDLIAIPIILLIAYLIWKYCIYD